jgi:predicted transcriptional regulator
MARPPHEQPTPGELEFLKILWQIGAPASVRDVMARLNATSDTPRAYTTVMSLLNVMTEKGLVRREPAGRAFVYEPVEPKDRTLREIVGETVDRVFCGSASQLVAHLLDQARPSEDELAAIRSLIEQYEARTSNTPKGGKGCRPSRSKRSAR